MAIDDNKSYELTGAQVKDLASKINAKADTSSLAAVATSGSYTDLTNTPSIPAAQVNSDWNANSGVAEILNKPNLATVATSGSYSDLTNKPTIPAAQVNSDWNANSGVAEILNKPNLATVATSGAYSDLSGTPTIPTVNDATLTITQNGTSAGTFTANASSNATIALTDTTYSVMTGATSGTAGTSGLVPAPAAGDESKVLSGAGTWVAQSGGGSDSNYFFMLDVSPTTGTAANPTNLRATTGVSTVQYNELVAAITANKNIILVKDLTYHDFYRVEEAFINSDGYVVLNISSFGAVGYYSLNGESEIKIFDPTYDPTNYPNGAALCVYYEANYLTNTAGSVSSTNLASSAVTTSKIANGTVTEAKLDWSTICYSNSPSETNGAFRVIDMTITRTINAGDNEFSISISSQVPTGFVPIGIIGMDFSGAGYSRIIVTRNYISGNTISCCFYQTYGSSQSITITWKILCIKSAN